MNIIENDIVERETLREKVDRALIFAEKNRTAILIALGALIGVIGTVAAIFAGIKGKKR